MNYEKFELKFVKGIDEFFQQTLRRKHGNGNNIGKIKHGR